MSATQRQHLGKFLLAEKSYTDIARETPSPRDAWRDENLIDKDKFGGCDEAAEKEEEDHRPKKRRKKPLKSPSSS